MCLCANLHHVLLTTTTNSTTANKTSRNVHGHLKEVTRDRITPPSLASLLSVSCLPILMCRHMSATNSITYTMPTRYSTDSFMFLEVSMLGFLYSFFFLFKIYFKFLFLHILFLRFMYIYRYKRYVRLCHEFNSTFFRLFYAPPMIEEPPLFIIQNIKKGLQIK